MLINNLVAFVAMATSALAARPQHTHPADATPTHTTVVSTGHGAEGSHPGLTDAHLRPNGSHVSLEARSGLAVYWCNHEDWKGTCHLDNNPLVCKDWLGGPYGSFGPDKGLKCRLYRGWGCVGDYAGGIRYPGYPNPDQSTNVQQAGIYSPGSWKCLLDK